MKQLLFFLSFVAVRAFCPSEPPIPSDYDCRGEDLDSGRQYDCYCSSSSGGTGCYYLEQQCQEATCWAECLRTAYTGTCEEYGEALGNYYDECFYSPRLFLETPLAECRDDTYWYSQVEDCPEQVCEECSEAIIGDGICDPICNNLRCRFDGGDCECPCSVSRLLDGNCDKACDVAACRWDHFQCGDAVDSSSGLDDCSSDCDLSYIGDGLCDTACNVPECGFDGLDCVSAACFANGCTKELIWNNHCDSACNVTDCAFDMGSCVMPPPNDCLNDVVSDEEWEDCYEDGDTVLCLEGCLDNFYDCLDDNDSGKCSCAAASCEYDCLDSPDCEEQLDYGCCVANGGDYWPPNSIFGPSCQTSALRDFCNGDEVKFPGADLVDAASTSAIMYTSLYVL